MYEKKKHKLGSQNLCAFIFSVNFFQCHISKHISNNVGVFVTFCDCFFHCIRIDFRYDWCGCHINAVGEFGEKYYTSNHYMIPNRLEAIICDVRKRMNNYTDIVTKDIDSKTLIDIICTVMYKYDAEPCEPYLDARTLEDKGKPCYATGRCRNKHCTCPLYKPDEE